MEVERDRIVNGRPHPAIGQEGLEAVALLRRTDGLTLRGGVTVAVDDRAVADRVGSAAQSVSSWIDAMRAVLGIVRPSWIDSISFSE